MNSYELSRLYWDFAFINPDKIKPHHTSIYFFAIEHCNRLGWKEKFGLPTSMVMEATGIKSYRTYKKHFDDLVDYGFLKIIEYSKNQYSSNIVAIALKAKALDKALDKALIKHTSKQSESTCQSIDSIIKQLNKEQLNKKQITNIKAIIEKYDTPNASGGLSFEDKFKLFINTFNELTKRTFKGCTKSKTQFKARLKDGYSGSEFKKAIMNAYDDNYHKETNHKYLTPEYITRSNMLEKYLNVKEIIPSIEERPIFG